MYVVKRDGRKEPVKFDKITARINKLSYGLNTQFCDPVSQGWGPADGLPPLLEPLRHVFTTRCLHSQVLVAQKVAMGVYRGVTTSELDELAAETAAAMTSMHPDYALVGYKCTGTLSSCWACLPDSSFLYCSWQPGSQSQTCTRTRSSPFQ